MEGDGTPRPSRGCWSEWSACESRWRNDQPMHRLTSPNATLFGYCKGMSRPPFILPRGKSAAPRTAEVLDVAARHLVYKLHDATEGIQGAWHVLGKIIREKGLKES